MRLVIAGGGTGGHLFPGLALAEELLSRGSDNAVLFMGTRGGLEERLVPQHGHRLEMLPSLKGGFLHLDAPRRCVWACKGYLRARRALLDFGAQAVVGLGGYASVLPILAAWGVEVPRMILEQNAVPGRATRLLAPFAGEIGVQLIETAARLPRNGKIKHTGNPLRKRIVAAARPARERNMALCEPPAEPHLLVLGGSQGARALNEIVVRAWPRLKKLLPALRVTLVAGPEDAERAAGAFAAAGMRGEVLPFHEAMEELYVQANVVLARAGATTLAEVSAFALPSILVPYPHAADDHQSANARAYTARGAAWLQVQANLEPERLAQRIADTLLQPERRKRMALASADLGKPYAAAEIVDRLERLAGLAVSALPVAALSA